MEEAKFQKIAESGISGVVFQNWSKTFGCLPELFFAPKTEDEIKQILHLAREQKKNVRVVGRGHSPSDIACTDGYMISLLDFNQVLMVDQTKLQVKVQAGITLTDLNEIHLRKYDLALPVLGSVSDITVGGAVSTATHGTGINYGVFSTCVEELEILTSAGEVVKCSSAENEDVFLAALCGLGCMGVILTVTLNCVPAFNLLQNQYALELKEVIEHLDAHLQSSDHFRFMWFPHSDGVVVSHVTKTDEAVTVKSWFATLCDWVLDYGIGYYVLEFCYYVSVSFPSIVPTINRIFYRLVFSRTTRHVDVSYKIFNFECLFKQYVNEWAIPKEQVGKVLWELKNWIDVNPQIPIHFPVEVRFVKGDNILISPAFGRDTCYINIIMYRPYNISVPYKEYWSAYEKIMREADGRPHWAKAHSVTAKEFDVLYPGFNTWCLMRRHMDPIDMFYNSYMNHIFNWKN